MRQKGFGFGRTDNRLSVLILGMFPEWDHENLLARRFETPITPPLEIHVYAYLHISNGTTNSLSKTQLRIIYGI